MNAQYPFNTSTSAKGHTIHLSPTQFFALVSNASRGDFKLNMLDVILLDDCEEGKRPSLWLYTDKSGFLRGRQIDSMTIDDLVRAVLHNLAGTDGEPSHSGILVFALIRD